MYDIFIDYWLEISLTLFRASISQDMCDKLEKKKDSAVATMKAKEALLNVVKEKCGLLGPNVLPVPMSCVSNIPKELCKTKVGLTSKVVSSAQTKAGLALLALEVTWCSVLAPALKIVKLVYYYTVKIG